MSDRGAWGIFSRTADAIALGIGVWWIYDILFPTWVGIGAGAVVGTARGLDWVFGGSA